MIVTTVSDGDGDDGDASCGDDAENKDGEIEMMLDLLVFPFKVECGYCVWCGCNTLFVVRDYDNECQGRDEKQKREA